MGSSDCSRSASRRSASLQSVLPDVTALRPSATLRSNICARSERWASLDAASRITAANFSITDWIRGRADIGAGQRRTDHRPDAACKVAYELHLVAGGRFRGCYEKGTK